VRQDYLDQIIWTQIIALLENEKLIQSEIDRREKRPAKRIPASGVKKFSAVSRHVCATRWNA